MLSFFCVIERLSLVRRRKRSRRRRRNGIINWTSLRRSCCNHSIDAALSLLRSGTGGIYGSKSGAMDGTDWWTDGQTDVRPLHRCLLCTMQPASTTDGNERMVVTKFTKWEIVICSWATCWLCHWMTGSVNWKTSTWKECSSWYLELTLYHYH